MLQNPSGEKSNKNPKLFTIDEDMPSVITNTSGLIPIFSNSGGEFPVEQPYFEPIDLRYRIGQPLRSECQPLLMKVQSDCLQ